MYYNIPFAKIQAGFSPILFSHLILIPIKLNKHLKNKKLIIQKVNKNKLSSFYQSLIEDLQFQPITLKEVENIIHTNDFNLLEDKKLLNSDKFALNIKRLNHIKNIAATIVRFNHKNPICVQHYLKKENNEKKSSLDINTIEDFYLLAASIFRKELNLLLHIKKEDNIFILQFNNIIDIIELDKFIFLEEVSKEKIILDNINSIMSWDIISMTRNEELKYLFTTYINQRKPLNDIFEQLSLDTDLELIQEICQIHQDMNPYEYNFNKLFFHLYIKYHYDKKFKKTHDIIYSDNEVILLLEEQKAFIWNLVDKCSKNHYLLSNIWSYQFEFYILSPFYYYNIKHYNTSIQNLYQFNCKSLTQELMLEYKVYKNNIENNNTEKDEDEELINFFSYSKLSLFSQRDINSLNLNDFDEIEQYIFEDLSYINKLLKTLIDKIQYTYNEHIFNNFKNIIKFCEFNFSDYKLYNLLPSLSSFNINNEDLCIFLDEFFEVHHQLETFDRRCKKNIVISLEDFNSIPNLYFNSQDSEQKQKRLHHYLFALLNFTSYYHIYYQDMNCEIEKNKFYSFLEPLFSRIFDFSQPQEITLILENYAQSHFSQDIKLQYHSNGILDSHFNIIIEYILIKNEELLKNLHIHNFFSEKKLSYCSCLYSKLVEKNIDYSFIFNWDFNKKSELDMICYISKNFHDITTHPNYPQSWKLNLIILLHQHSLDLINFTKKEFDILFAKQDIGIQLIKQKSNIYIKLPAHIQEVPAYAETFIEYSNIKDYTNFTFRPILFKYHDFCLSLINNNSNWIEYIPKEHWNNKFFVLDFFKLMDVKKNKLSSFEKYLPIPIVQFFHNYQIYSNFYDFLQSYNLKNEIDNKIIKNINNKIIKKKKI